MGICRDAAARLRARDPAQFVAIQVHIGQPLPVKQGRISGLAKMRESCYDNMRLAV